MSSTREARLSSLNVRTSEFYSLTVCMKGGWEEMGFCCYGLHPVRRQNKRKYFLYISLKGQFTPKWTLGPNVAVSDFLSSMEYRRRSLAEWDQNKKLMRQGLSSSKNDTKAPKYHKSFSALYCTFSKRCGGFVWRTDQHLTQVISFKYGVTKRVVSGLA